MYKFYIRVAVYLICFVFSLFGLNAIDFNRYIKKGKVVEAWLLYFIIAFCLAYLFGQFIMSIIYWFY